MTQANTSQIGHEHAETNRYRRIPVLAPGMSLSMFFAISYVLCVGARVKVTAGDLAVYDQRKGGMSYQSAQDPRLHFGLGEHAQVDAVEIVWPSGMISKLEKLKSDQIIAVKEGVGLVDRPFPRVQAK